MFISILVLAEFIMRKKSPEFRLFFWSSAIVRMEWNGMTDVIPIIPIIDPLSDLPVPPRYLSASE